MLTFFQNLTLGELLSILERYRELKLFIKYRMYSFYLNKKKIYMYKGMCKREKFFEKICGIPLILTTKSEVKKNFKLKSSIHVKLLK